MNFEEFREALKKELSQALPSYTIQDMMYRGDKQGICIKKDTENLGRIFNMEPFFAEYRNGYSIKEIVNNISDIVKEPLPEMGTSIDNIMSFDKVKDNIFLCVDAIEKNPEYYRNIVTKNIKELSLKAYVRVIQDEFSVAVTNEMMKTWKISKSKLFDLADKNTFAYMDILDLDLGMISVSNKYNSFGAGTMINEKCLKALHQKMGDFYILPDSIDNIMVLSKTAVKNAEMTDRDIQNMMKEVHEATELPKDKEFSPNIFFYNKKALTLINTFATYNVRIPFKFPSEPKPHL